MPLTDKQIQALRVSEGRVAKHTDGGGLQLWVTPSGAKLWNLAYRFAGKQRKLAIGAYPVIPLKEARARRDQAKRQLDAGLDPSQQKRLAKLAATAEQANTFEALAAEFRDKKRGEGKAAATLSKLEWLIGSKADARRAADYRNHRPGSPQGLARRRGARPARNREAVARSHWLNIPLCGRDWKGGQ